MPEIPCKEKDTNVVSLLSQTARITKSGNILLFGLMWDGEVWGVGGPIRSVFIGSWVGLS